MSVPTGEQPVPLAAPYITPPASSRAVPWTVRDTWIGLMVLPFLVLLVAGPLVLYQRQTNADLSMGLVLLVGEFAIILPVVWFALRRHASLADLGFRPFSAKALLAGCGGLLFTYMLVLSFLVFVVAVCLALDIPLPDTSPAALLAQLPDPWLTFLVAVVAAPLTEELFFRGFFFAGLRQRLGWVWAAAISGVIFGLFHLDPLQFVPLTVVGILLAAVYHYTNSIWLPIILHASLNLFGLSIAFWLVNSGLL